MGSWCPEILHDVPPYIRVYKDGSIERLVATEVAPAGFEPQTGVFSKDVLVSPETGLTARLYRPNLITKIQRLPLIIYFHGGAFCIATAAEPKYHSFVNLLVAEAKVIALSVDYRRAPEHPLPAAYEDSWQVLSWVASHNSEEGSEDWLRASVDFGRIFLAGDSAGANISHHMAIRAGQGIDLKLQGMLMIHPYFWGEKPIGLEIKDPFRKAMVDKWWQFVCTSDKGCDDPLINPFVDGTSDLEDLNCDRILIFVAENDILSERGKHYYQSLVNSPWKGNAEMVESKGEDHVFHIFNPSCEKAQALIQGCAAFLNEV